MTALGLSEGGEERHERPPVHYQISITGRQAAFFFLLLLVALALAFFFGMKTGAAARRGPGPVATAAELPVPTLAPVEHTRGEKKPAEEALGFAADQRVALKEAAAATPVPAPTAVPTAKPPAPTAAPPAKEAAPAKPAPKGPFWVQVLATKKAQAADELMKRLKGEGFAADVWAVPGKAGWFRVRVGPFKDRARADATARKIKAADKQIKNIPLVTP